MEQAFTVVIAVGVDTVGGLVAAHPPRRAHTFTLLGDRLAAADNALRAIAARPNFHGLPVKWTDDTRV